MARTVPLRERQAWFALADAERCRLLRCSVTERGTQHVNEHERLENTLPEQEHVRPVTAGVRHTMSRTTSDDSPVRS